MIKLGGASNISIRLLETWPGGLYFSPVVENSNPDLHRFLIDRYFGDGAHLFGPPNTVDMAAVRDAAGGGMLQQSDEVVYLVVEYFVQRVRNYAHIDTMSAAGITTARVIPHFPVSEICKHHGKREVDVTGAALKLRHLRSLSHLDYKHYAFGQDSGFPPYLVGCTCRMEGIILGLD